MLLKRWFGGVMTGLCLTYSVILPVTTLNMQMNQKNSITETTSKVSTPARAKVQQTVQPPRNNKPLVAKTWTPTQVQKTAKVAPVQAQKATSPVQVQTQVQTQVQKPANTKVAAASASTVKTKAAKSGITLSDYQFEMLVRIISAEAKGEPFKGQVAVGAVILNRMKSEKFPDTVSENVLKPGQFEPVANGQIWKKPVSSAYRAARMAVNGWDPTYGALYFYNPSKSSSRWIWSRRAIIQIGDHIFAA